MDDLHSAEGSYRVTDRRPIRTRDSAFAAALTSWLVARRTSPNAISITGMVCCVGAGGLFLDTSHVGPWAARGLWLVGAVLVQLRLLCNLLDGMVAVAAGSASATGELFNEAPDRVSDVATLVGAGYAVGGWPVLGWAAAVGALGTAYVRLLGKSVGAAADFRGPMAKQHRMACVTVVAIFNAVTPPRFQAFHPTGICLAVICAGCLVTIRRRLGRTAGVLKGPR